MTATDASGSERLPSQTQDPIIFTVNRTGAVGGTIVVGLAWSGSATFGSDYTVTASGTGVTLSADKLSLTFAPGATSATVTVTPIDDAIVESAETVTLTLLAGTGYNVGSPASANGLITDNDTAAPVVTVGVTDSSGAEQGSDPITFIVSRNSGQQQITVNLVWSGTATLGIGGDYTVSGSGLSADGSQLTFATGVTSITITVTPIDDNAHRADRGRDADRHERNRLHGRLALRARAARSSTTTRPSSP